jgi:hypothetical protein
MPAPPPLRRLLIPLVLVALAALVASRLRTRPSAVPIAPPEWPPLPASKAPSTVSSTANAAPVVAAPDTTWAPPGDDGACPVGFPVKAKESSGIYHLPDGRFYDRTNADRCYVDAAAAEADGYRRSKT